MHLNTGDFKPVTKELLYTKIADAIIGYIETNDLHEGSKIPSERTLAELLSTSRNSVREALRVLENEQIVEVKTGKGTYVTSNAPKDAILFRLWEVDFKELIQVKYFLEKEIITEVCQNITEKQIACLEESLVKIEKAKENGLYLEDEDHIFHKKLRDMSGNRMLVQIVDILMHYLDKYGLSLQGSDKYWMATIPSHRALMDELKNRDTKKALQAYQDIYELDLEVLQLVKNKKTRK